MNKKILLFLALFIIQLSLLASDSLYSALGSSSVSLIKKITVHHDITVVLVCDRTKLVLNDAIEQKFLKIEIKNDELIIGKKHSWFCDKKIVYYLEVKDLKNITVLDDANIISNQSINCAKDLTLLVKGDGVIDLVLNAEKIKVVSKGSAKIHIKGNFSSSRTWLDGYGGLVTEYLK